MFDASLADASNQEWIKLPIISVVFSDILLAITNDNIVGMKVIIQAEMMPGIVIGIIVLTKTWESWRLNLLPLQSGFYPFLAFGYKVAKWQMANSHRPYR